MTRLNKYIARSGICSRRGADELIQTGEIKLNGRIITKLGSVINPNKDKVQYKGKTLSPEGSVTFAFYKPKGVTSTMHDRHAKKVVADYFKHVGRVYPVGRLDKDSEGLMIVTNNGNLAQELTHPSFSHEKEYEVLLSGESDRNLNKFQDKHEVEGYLIKPMGFKIVKTYSGNNWLISLVLKEGRKRQIREVAENLGYKVKSLKRVRIGKLKLNSLGIGPGEFKEINTQF